MACSWVIALFRHRTESGKSLEIELGTILFPSPFKVEKNRHVKYFIELLQIRIVKRFKPQTGHLPSLLRIEVGELFRKDHSMMKTQVDSPHSFGFI